MNNTIDKRDYARAVQANVIRCLEHHPHDLFEIQAVVGFDIGASDEQVKYAVRVLRVNGNVGYDKALGRYYLISSPYEEAER
jgi:hypothetical protein